MGRVCFLYSNKKYVLESRFSFLSGPAFFPVRSLKGVWYLKYIYFNSNTCRAPVVCQTTPAHLIFTVTQTQCLDWSPKTQELGFPHSFSLLTTLV